MREIKGVIQDRKMFSGFPNHQKIVLSHIFNLRKPCNIIDTHNRPKTVPQLSKAERGESFNLSNNSNNTFLYN